MFRSEETDGIMRKNETSKGDRCATCTPGDSKDGLGSRPNNTISITV
jgi:hypothetical protein